MCSYYVAASARNLAGGWTPRGGSDRGPNTTKSNMTQTDQAADGAEHSHLNNDSEVPETIWLVPDVGTDAGRDLLDDYADLVGGTPVIEQTRIENTVTPTCEVCRNTRDDCYRLPADLYGVPVCRDCLTAAQPVEQIVTDLDELKPRKKP